MARAPESAYPVITARAPPARANPSRAIPKESAGGAPVYESILECIGNTPLVRLRKVTAGLSRRVYVKWST